MFLIFYSLTFGHPDFNTLNFVVSFFILKAQPRWLLNYLKICNCLFSLYLLQLVQCDRRMKHTMSLRS